MKFLRVILLLLLIALVWSGVREKTVVARLKAQHETLVARATALGLPEKESDDARALARASGRPSAAKPAGEHLKDDLVAAYHRLKALEGSEDSDAKLKVQAEVREWIGWLIDLSPKELKRMIADLTSDASLDPKEVRELVAVALNLAAARQGETAAELALAHREQGGSVIGVIGGWAQQDPAGAFAWLEKNRQQLGNDYQAALQQATKQSSASDPVGALTALEQIEGRERQATAKELASRLVDDPARSALMAAMKEKRLSDGDELDVMNGLGKSMTEHFGDVNAEWLKDVSPREAMLLAFGVSQSNKALDHPGTWLDWMGTSLEPEQMNSTAKPLLTKWINDDYEAAGEWINRQPAGDFRNEAAANYARMMAKRFPDTAKDWANTLPEGPERRRLLNDLAK